jgi:flagellar biosynthesis protein FlhF
LGFPEPLPATPGEEPIVAMLVGPTGAGKTTNLAKLAARYALEYEWEVEIVAADAYRVGAVEHLTQYAGLMGINIRSAQNPGELRRRVNNSEADLVLVDSAGRNHRDDARMADLDDLVHAAQPDYVFLCVSLTSREEYTLEVINRYRHIGFNRLFFTKLDETEQFGSCLNIAAHTGTALSYISKGQRVPEDLVEANAHELAARLLEVNNDE